MTGTCRQTPRRIVVEATGSSYLCTDSGSFRLAVQETGHDLPPRLDKRDLEDPIAWRNRLLLWICKQS